MEYIYADIIPFRQFSPCTSLLCIPQTWRNCPGAKFLFTPEQQGREVGTARLPAVTLPCLECLITHIHSYLYYYPYYFIYLFKGDKTKCVN